MTTPVSTTTPLINSSTMSINVIHKLISNNDKGLVELSLRRKLIGVEPARFRLLFSSLCGNTTVRSVDVAQNNLDDALLLFMVECLIKNHSVQQLDVSGNALCDVGPFLRLARRNLQLLDLKLFDPSLEQPPPSLTRAFSARLAYFLQANAAFLAVRQGAVAEAELVGRGVLSQPPLRLPYGHLVRVDLSHNLLSHVPPSLFDLPLLRELVLKHNQLRAVSPLLGNLQRLQLLSLAHNHLNHLPAAALLRLRALVVLDLAHNDLLSLPAQEIASLPALSHLYVHGNVLIDNVPFELLDALAPADHASALAHLRAHHEPLPAAAQAAQVAQPIEEHSFRAGLKLFKGFSLFGGGGSAPSPPSPAKPDQKPDHDDHRKSTRILQVTLPPSSSSNSSSSNLISSSNLTSSSSSTTTTTTTLSPASITSPSFPSSSSSSSSTSSTSSSSSLSASHASPNPLSFSMPPSSSSSSYSSHPSSHPSSSHSSPPPSSPSFLSSSSSSSSLRVSPSPEFRPATPTHARTNSSSSLAARPSPAAPARPDALPASYSTLASPTIPISEAQKAIKRFPSNMPPAPPTPPSSPSPSSPSTPASSSPSSATPLPRGIPPHRADTWTRSGDPDAVAPHTSTIGTFRKT